MVALLHLVFVNFRRFAVILFKQHGKIARIIEADRVCNVCNAQIGCTEQFGGFLQTQVIDIGRRRIAGLAFKQIAKIMLT